MVITVKQTHGFGGTCDQDMFNAYDSETNAWVWGSCDL